MVKTEHKSWLANEYTQWVQALNESTVHNFKEHPMVKRMLGEIDSIPFITGHEGALWPPVGRYDYNLLNTIDSIGKNNMEGTSGTGYRMIYYAQKIFKINPPSITEIGGGVGQFYAILRALGYKGEYFIADLPDVVRFQKSYLAEVYIQTGLHLPLLKEPKYDFCCSFYALGEFDDETKKWYVENLVNKCKHGCIAWNPHSGASDHPEYIQHDMQIEPGIEEGIKIIQW